MNRYVKTSGLTIAGFIAAVYVVVFGALQWMKGKNWEKETIRYARSAGRTEAMLLFRNGRMWKYELDGERHDTVMLRNENGFDVFAIDYFPNLGKAHRISKSEYVKSFNEMMDHMSKDPEKFLFNATAEVRNGISTEDNEQKEANKSPAPTPPRVPSVPE